MIRRIGLAVLYLLASPIYLVIGIRKLVRFWRIRRTMRAGTITCVHCGIENQIDILATCGKCKATEYGNRLRCSACGDTAKAFDCDACGVTIRVL
jgi:hypothetical protein